jgi:DNA-directed RNA polymerase subunit M/transcription elongation factor TFIIS
MADDMVVLQCEACSTRLKIRAVTARIMKDVKCPKCGRKVSTKSLAPGGDAGCAGRPRSCLLPRPYLPLPICPWLRHPCARARPGSCASRGACSRTGRAGGGGAGGRHGAALARARVAELEQQVEPVADRACGGVTAWPSPTSAAEADLLRARVRRWPSRNSVSPSCKNCGYEKEKEARTAITTAQRAQQERKAALDQIEAVLRSYHEAEIEAATDRINNLNVRLQNLLARRIWRRKPADSRRMNRRSSAEGAVAKLSRRCWASRVVWWRPPRPRAGSCVCARGRPARRARFPGRRSAGRARCGTSLPPRRRS